MEFEDNIELVIKIPKDKLWSIKNEPIKQNFSIYELASYIDKGMPIREGHGKIVDEVEEKAYNRGLAEAWECARKMCLMSSEERLRAFDVSGNHLAILSDLEATKALEKIKAYEEQQKQTENIKVGDEVRDDVYGHIGVVITDKPSLCDHRISVWFPDYSHVQLISINNLTKTNRHFSQISKVQEELRGTE